MEEVRRVLGHLHSIGGEEDDTRTVVGLSSEQMAQVVDLVRTALGELLDPPEEVEDPSNVTEFWLADFPVVISVCSECTTITVQILGREIQTVHFSVEVAEHLHDVVTVGENDFVVAYHRKDDDEDGARLYVTRIAYRVALPDEDATWAMTRELVNLFDALIAILVAAVAE